MEELPIFQKFSKLKENEPWQPLGNFPTKVHELTNLEKTLNAESIWIKRDDESGDKYGGNKVRKLEFLLAEAREKEAKTVVTAGGIGSHHCLAVTIYFGESGIKPVVILTKQPVTGHVKENLLLDHYFGAEMHYAPSYLSVLLTSVKEIIKRKIKGEKPYLLFPGGSTPLSSLGYANAMIELEKQVKRNELPPPDQIFVPLGSGGTMAGLLAGKILTCLKTKIEGIRVVQKIAANSIRVAQLTNKTLELIQKYTPKKLDKVSAREVRINDEYYGGKYGYYTKEAKNAIELVKENESIKLEGTYTGKAFAALLDFIKKERNREKNILFWNTYNSVKFDPILEKYPHTRLPKEFQQFFKNTTELEN